MITQRDLIDHRLHGVVMSRRALPVAAFLACLLALPAGAQAGTFAPGTPGVGDSYYPLDGNGGYDALHYGLDLRYTPKTDVLAGVATIRARAKQNLSRFNLDLDGLTVRSVTVNGKRAKWGRANGELTVVPSRGLRRGVGFSTVVTYDGVPIPPPDDPLGGSGWVATDDGALVAGEPHGATTWFPANDHPTDKASFTFKVTVPQGTEAVANGALVGQRTRNGWTTWTWDARDPMAAYLATATIGQFDLRSYRKNGIAFWDAIDPDLYTPRPRTGKQYAISQLATPSYKRLTRTIDVPADGGKLSFWMSGQGLVFVEARPAGTDQWTTLPDLNGHTTSEDAGFCEFYLEFHPFLKHYFKPLGEDGCRPTGSTGAWHYWMNDANGYEQWAVDLSKYKKRTVEVSISVVSDEFDVGRPGVLVDDIVGPGGATTSFEPDTKPMDGWRATSAPTGSPKNKNNWIAGPRAKAPDAEGEIFQQSFARHGEILGFLGSKVGAYPFRVGGGIVDDFGLGFSLENQTRPVYDASAASEPGGPDALLAHELAHQWFGDSVSVTRWRDIWLNEGFATYAQWMWDAHDGIASEEETFKLNYEFADGDPEFWKLPMTNPGTDALFGWPIYQRGAMVLHRLRKTVGDATFFRILRTWTKRNANGNVTTDGFLQLSERLAGRDLSKAVWDPWLFGLKQPPLPASAAAVKARGRQNPPHGDDKDTRGDRGSLRPGARGWGPPAYGPADRGGLRP